jgi:hypothetical protein
VRDASRTQARTVIRSPRAREQHWRYEDAIDMSLIYSTVTKRWEAIPECRLPA